MKFYDNSQVTKLCDKACKMDVACKCLKHLLMQKISLNITLSIHHICINSLVLSEQEINI